MTEITEARQALEARAAELDLSFEADITDAKLKALIARQEKLLAKAEAKDAEENVLVVVGPKKGRRRAGRHFTPEPTAIPVSELSKEEFDALVSDPALVVTPRPAEEG